jgi:cation diffusion facilitator CzcD-associated flavoprotein CzcO
MTQPDFEVAIIGAGPGGIAAAHLLQRRGIDDFVIVERGHDFGGTWRDNHYPGLAVDIPSLWYQLSFNPNPNWSRLFAPGPELYRYFQDTASKLASTRGCRRTPKSFANSGTTRLESGG